MKTFTKRRKATKALHDFSPGMEVDDSMIPVSVLIVSALAIIGAVSIVYIAGIVIINLF